MIFIFQIRIFILVINTIKLKYPKTKMVIHQFILFLLLNNILRVINWIKEVLNEKGIEQNWLSEKVGKSFNMVNEYCKDKR